MGLGDFFAKINNWLDEKYTSFSEFFTEKGIPIQRYNEFLQEHGIPPMWFSIFLLILIIVVIILLTMLIFTSTIIIHATFADDSGNKITQSINLNLKFDNESVFNQFVLDGDLEIQGVRTGDVLQVSANLEGYSLITPYEILVSGKEMYVQFIFKKVEKLGTIQLRLLDAEKQTVISGAKVTIYDGVEAIFEGTSDDGGVVNVPQIPVAKPLKVKILAEGYNELDSTELFASNVIKDMELEPKTIASGAMGTITFMVSANADPLGDVKVSIYNFETKKLIDEVVSDATGIAIMNVPQGVILRYVASKEGFVKEDSAEKNKNFTLRENTKTVNVYMTVGGTTLVVLVEDESKSPVTGATVVLYSQNGLTLDTNTTNVFGNLEFEGINVKSTGYVSVYALGYYPTSAFVNPLTQTKVTLVLKKIDLSSAARLQVFVTDKSNKPVANATVEVWLQGEKELPLYLPDARTSITGLYLAQLEPNTIIKVSAFTEELTGSKTLLLTPGENKVEIVLSHKLKLSTLYVYGVAGDLLKGAQISVKTETASLFEGVTGEDGSVIFTPGSAKSVEVTVIGPDGTVYTKIAPVAEKMELRLEKINISKNPKISFVGIYDAQNTKVNGVKVGETYYFKFSVIWPKGQKIGEAHVRLGPDNLPAMSQSYGITGVDAISAVQKEFGLYYTTSPTTSTVKDLSVFGKPGLKNKWITLKYNNPTGSTEFKVKVSIEKDLSLDKLDLHYRAISFDGTLYYLDNGASADFSSKFKRLYAPANYETINVFTSLFECSNLVCYSYAFVDEYTKYEPFNPVVGQVYGLDLDFYATEDVVGVLEFSAPNLLKTVYLNNIIDQNLDTFEPKDFENYSLNYTLSAKKGEHKKIRLYFSVPKIGTGTISLKSSMLGLNKNFDFTISGQKNLFVTLNGNGILEFGKPVIFTVKDNQGLVKDAIIKVSAQKELINLFVQGNATEGKGKDGQYILKDLPSGVYKYEVKVPQHITVVGDFVITRFGVLGVPQEIEIKIPKGQKKRIYEFDVTNKSNFLLTNPGLEILRDDAKAFTVSYKFVKSVLPAGTSTKVVVTVETDVDSVVYGDQDIVVTATLETKEVVRQKTHIVFIANTDLDSSCLIVTPPQLSVLLYDNVQKTYNATLRVENKCEFDLVLNPALVSRDTGELIPWLKFSSTSASLKPNTVKTMQFSFGTNMIASAQGFAGNFFINLDSGYFKKQVPVYIQIVKGFGMLNLSTVQHLFLTAGQPLSFPLMMQNFGNVPVRQVTISILPYNNTPFTMNIPYDDSPQSEYYNPLINGPQMKPHYNPQGIYMQSLNPTDVWGPAGTALDASSYIGSFILPVPRVVPLLYPGQAGSVMLYAKTPFPQKSNVQVAYTIVARGFSQIDNQPVVAYTPIFVSISSQKCLKVVGAPITFLSGKTGIYLENDKLNVVNECAEPITLQLPLKDSVKGTKTTIEVTGEQLTIEPKQSVPVKTTLFAADELDTKFSFNIVAVGTQTNKPYDVTVLYIVRVGRHAAGVTGALPFSEKEMKICGTDNTKKLIFPRINSAECETGYCDGQRASEYLLAKIKGFIEEYNNKSAKFVNSLDSTLCNPEKGACSFDKFGLVNPTFTMYMMNDKVSDNYIQELLKTSNMHLKSVSIVPTKDYDIEEQSNILLSKLYVDSTFNKCGKYTVELKGAVQIVSNSLQRESYNVFVSATHEPTKECEPTVASAGLFLPADNKATKDSAHGFMMGYIDYDKTISGFDSLAKDISKKLFNQERVASGKPNSMYLTRQTMTDRMFDVKVKVSEQQVTIIVTVNNSLELANKKVREDLFSGLVAFFQGNPIIGCISEDEKEIHVESVGEIKEGAFKIIPCGKPILANAGTKTCEFSVIGPASGVADILLSPDSANGYTAKITSLESQEPVSSVNFYSALQNKLKVQVDITDPAATLGSVKSVPLKILLRPSQSAEISVDVPFDSCGVDPATFVSGVLNSGLNSSEYVAQTDWKSEPESKDGCDVIKEVQTKTKNIFMNSSTAGGQTCSGTNVKALAASIEKGFVSATAAAAGAAIVACGASEAVLGYKKLLGPFGYIAAGVTCGITTVILVTDSVYANHRFNVSVGNASTNWVDNLHDSMQKNWYTGGFLFDDYTQPTTGEGIDWTKGVTVVGVGAATKIPQGIKDIKAIPKPGPPELFGKLQLTPAEVDVVTKFQGSLQKTIGDPAKLSGVYNTGGDYEKVFKLLAKNDPEFSKSYDEFKALATAKGIKPEELFKEGLAKAQKTMLSDYTSAVKKVGALDTELDAIEATEKKLTQEIKNLEVAKAKITPPNKLQSELAAAKAKDVALNKEILTLNKEFDKPNLSSAEQDALYTKSTKLAKEFDLVQDEVVKIETKIKQATMSDVVKIDKEISAAESKLTSTKSEIAKLTEKSIAAEKEVAKASTALEKLAPGEIKPTTTAGSKLSAFGKKAKTFGKGLLKGAVSATAAWVAYELAWGKMIGETFEAKQMTLVVPDYFVKNESYLFTVLKTGPNAYRGDITEAANSATTGFCTPEFLSKGYKEGGVDITGLNNIFEGTGNETEGEEYISSQCSSFANLFKKYGDVLSQATNGKMDSKDIIAQMSNESGFNPNAKSRTNALGLGQFIQGTFCDVTKSLAIDKFPEYSSKFPVEELKKYGANNWLDLYNKTCNPVKTQCEGGILIPTSDKCSYDVSKDPRTNPELAVMYTALYMGNLFNKKASTRAAIESYVVGPGCVLGDGIYSTTEKCKKNITNNPVDKGKYWAKYKAKVAAADSCLGAAWTATAQAKTSAPVSGSCDKSIALLGDSITVGYAKDVKKMTQSEKCNLAFSSGQLTYPGQDCKDDYLYCGGKSTGWMLVQLKKNLLGADNKPKYSEIVVMGGTNDLSNSDYFNVITSNLSQIYAYAKSNGVKVIAVSIVPGPDEDKIKKVNAWIAQQKTAGKVDEYVNVHGSLLADLYKNTPPTNVHNAQSYPLIAQAVYEQVLKAA